MTLVSPSLLSADFSHLDRDLDMINRSEADMLHLDVMDGVFVPNISFGFPVMKYVRRDCKKPLDAHFMITDPGRYVSQTRDCGIDLMNVHAEACLHLHRVIQQIKSAGMKAGVTINPATPVVMLEDIITDVDLVLIMSVNPGFAAQKFIPQAVNKIAQTRKLIADSGSKALIEVDGGINPDTGRQCVEAGADMLVAGNYVFSAPDPLGAIASLKSL